ncbi:hypothetical protein O4157_10605 [Gordonia amicalis]|uniref:hypothetical protein n=1 Tax=Gordonia amicalis TaxID=89053 RepID=UPI0022B4C80F|nr:hypothetical protein [Gordonia amicalis]MCZ4651883.1 hypothetical protein [Gordonia amicalis]
MTAGQSDLTVRGGQISIDRFTCLGTACVVVGGLVAAVARPLDLTKGSWLAAYLVLVCGVALAVIGAAQQHTREPVPPGVQHLQLTGWVVANGLVIVGSLAELPYVVDAGSLILFPVLALTAWAGRSLARDFPLAGDAYLATIFVLASSIPVGIVLAHR